MTQGLAERPLRILHCFRSPVGGIFRHVRDLIEYHSAAGYEVGILCDSNTGGAHEDRLFEDIMPRLQLGLTRIPIRRSITPADLPAINRASTAIRDLQPDILHGHGAKGGAVARVAGSRLRASGSRVARFYTPHGGSLHYSAWQPHGWFFFALERLLERWTDQLIFVSDYERSAYFSKIGEPRIPWQLVYNGIRESEFEPVAPEQNAADFLYIGMMRRLKGPDRFIDAFKRAEELTGRTLTGVMIGDGEDYDLCRNMIERHRLSDRIAIRAAMPAREAFALGKVVVVPSRAESMPYIVLEAVAAGKSVIASKVGGIPEILGKNSPALVSAEDIEPLASAMARAILDPSALADAMPDMAAFRQRFSARIMASRIAEIYLSSLARPVATSGAPLPIY